MTDGHIVIDGIDVYQEGGLVHLVDLIDDRSGISMKPETLGQLAQIVALRPQDAPAAPVPLAPAPAAPPKVERQGNCPGCSRGFEFVEGPVFCPICSAWVAPLVAEAA